MEQRFKGAAVPIVFREGTLFLRMTGGFSTSLFREEHYRGVRVNFHNAFVRAFKSVQEADACSFVIQRRFRRILRQFLSGQPTVLNGYNDAIVQKIRTSDREYSA